jgi:predicted acylesterase/phospholipase RssA
LAKVYQIKLLSDRPLYRRYRASWRLHPSKDESYYISSLSYQELKELAKKHFRTIRVFEIAEVPLRPVYPFEVILHGFPPDDVITEVMAKALAEETKGRLPTPIYLGRTNVQIGDSFVLDRPGGRRNYRWRFSLNPPKTTQLEDKLTSLKKRLRDKRSRVVLSLGGGGLRLFAHASVMKILDLLDARQHIDEIWGCSGGAIAGLVYSMGVAPDLIEKEGYDLYNERYNFILSPSKLQVLKNITSDWLLSSNPFTLKGFMDIQKSLQESIARLAEGRKIQIPFYSIAYNLHEKCNEILTPTQFKKSDYNGLMHRTEAIDAVLASSSIPILYVPRIIKRGKTECLYVDGGTAEEVPLVSVYKKWKIDRAKKMTDKKKLFVLAVNLFPQVSGWRIFRNRMFRKLPFIDVLKWSSHVADLIRRARIEDHLHVLREDPNVEVWELVLPVKGLGVLDPKEIPRIITGAHNSFIQQLLALDEGKPMKHVGLDSLGLYKS